MSNVYAMRCVMMCCMRGCAVDAWMLRLRQQKPGWQNSQCRLCPMCVCGQILEGRNGPLKPG